MENSWANSEASKARSTFEKEISYRCLDLDISILKAMRDKDGNSLPSSHIIGFSEGYVNYCILGYCLYLCLMEECLL